MPTPLSRTNGPAVSRTQSRDADGLSQALTRFKALGSRDELSSAEAQEFDQLKGNIAMLGRARLAQLAQRPELSSAEAEEYSRLRGTVVMAGLDHLANLSKRDELSSAEAAELPSLKSDIGRLGREMMKELQGRELSSGESQDLSRLRVDLPKLTGGSWAPR